MGFRMLRALSAGLLLVLFTGCTYSSQYVPKRTDRAALVLEDNKMVIRKGTERESLFPYQGYGFGTRNAPRSEMFDCDAKAVEFVDVADEHGATAQVWATVANIYAVVSILTVPIYYLSYWPLYAMTAIGGSHARMSVANMIDAVNRINDVAACTGGGGGSGGSGASGRETDGDAPPPARLAPPPAGDPPPEPEALPDSESLNDGSSNDGSSNNEGKEGSR